ncbi:hypothetical protein GCM10022205_29240 [Spinactinospora alkalitolerans]
MVPAWFFSVLGVFLATWPAYPLCPGSNVAGAVDAADEQATDETSALSHPPVTRRACKAAFFRKVTRVTAVSYRWPSLPVRALKGSA